MSPEVTDFGHLLKNEAQTVTVSNGTDIKATLRYQGLVSDGGIYTQGIAAPTDVSPGDIKAYTVGVSKEGPTIIQGVIQQDWVFDVQASVSARGGYGPLIYDGLVASSYHPENWKGVLHENAGTASTQCLTILSYFKAYEALRGNPDTLAVAETYRDNAVTLLRALSDFDNNGPVLRQPIPELSRTLVIPNEFFAAKGATNVPRGEAFQKYPSLKATPEGFAAGTPETYRWMDKALTLAIEYGPQREAAKWSRLRAAIRYSIVQTHNASDQRFFFRANPYKAVFAEEGAYANTSVSGSNSTARYSRSPLTGAIELDIPLGDGHNWETTRLARTKKDSWRTASVIHEADQYLSIDLGVLRQQSVYFAAGNLNTERPRVQPYLSTSASDPANNKYIVSKDFSPVGGQVPWSDLKLLKKYLYPLSAFVNSKGVTLAAGSVISEVGIEFTIPSSTSYTAAVGDVRLLSGPSQAWVQENLRRASMGSRVPYSPGAAPFAVNANLKSREVEELNLDLFFGNQLPDVWVELESEAKYALPDPETFDFPTVHVNTQQIENLVSLRTESGFTKPSNLLLMEQQILFLRDSADAWFRDTGVRGPFAHTFRINHPENAGDPDVHKWLYGHTGIKASWIGYQVRVVESLAQTCYLLKDEYASQDAVAKARLLLVAWLNWVNAVWPNLSGSPFKGMPTEVRGTGQIETTYEDVRASAVLLRACLFTKAAFPEHELLSNELMQRCWSHLELNWRKTGEMAFTWSPVPNSRKWYGHTHAEVIWTLSEVLNVGEGGLPVEIPLSTVRDRLVQTQSWLEGTGIVDARHRVELPFSGFRAARMTSYPNWSDTFLVSRTYRTDIFTSSSGETLRRALRETPRKNIEFGVLMSHQEMRDFQTDLAVAHNRPVIVPELTRFTRIRKPAAKGQSVVVVTSVPEWLSPGSLINISDREVAEVHFVEAVYRDQVFLATPLRHRWSTDIKVSHAVVGQLNPDFNVARPTGSVLTGRVSIDVLPGSESVPELREVPLDQMYPGLTEAPYFAPLVSAPVGSTDLIFHDGEDILLLPPNWAESVDQGFKWPVSKLDYEYGLVEYDRDIKFPTRKFKATLDCDTPEKVVFLERFFDRVRGAQGNFWMPSWDNDFVATTGLQMETFELQIESSRTVDLLLDSEIYQSIAVITSDRQVLVNTVLDVTTSSGITTLTLRDPWPTGVALENIKMVSWLPVWRMTSDAQVFTWLTDTVAQVVIECETDKAVRYDPEDVGNLRRGVTYVSRLLYEDDAFPAAETNRANAKGLVLVDGNLRNVVKTINPLIETDVARAGGLSFEGVTLRKLVKTLDPLIEENAASAKGLDVVSVELKSLVKETGPLEEPETAQGRELQLLTGVLEKKVFSVPPVTEGAVSADSLVIVSGVLEKAP